MKTLREQFENEVRAIYKGHSLATILFETNDKNYIIWLEKKIKQRN